MENLIKSRLTKPKKNWLAVLSLAQLSPSLSIVFVSPVVIHHTIPRHGSHCSGSESMTRASLMDVARMMARVCLGLEVSSLRIQGFISVLP